MLGEAGKEILVLFRCGCGVAGDFFGVECVPEKVSEFCLLGMERESKQAEGEQGEE